MYKSRLEELRQQRNWRLPEYGTTKVGPRNAPWFYATVTVSGFDFHTVDAFRSSKEAQNETAKDSLDHLSDYLQPIPGPSSFPQPCLPSSSSAPYCSDMQHLSKNQLQTYAQKRNLPPPVYSCEREGPPHNSRFKCKVTIGGQTYEGQEFLPTLKDAERAAAKGAALTSILPNGVQEDHSGLYKNFLQELTQKTGFSIPVYSLRISGEPHVPVFVSSVEVQGEIFTGEEARSRKQAELSAAKVAYYTLREPYTLLIWGVDMQHLSKNQLQTYAQKRNLPPPVYSCEREGPPHNSRFKCKVTIGGQTYEGQEFLPTLKDAERAAAKGAALTSILPNGVQEDHSGLCKNLLQELIQNAGFSIPVYSLRISGEPHVPVFVSSVEVQGEIFTGEEARSKKQA